MQQVGQSVSNGSQTQNIQGGGFLQGPQQGGYPLGRGGVEIKPSQRGGGLVVGQMGQSRTVTNRTITMGV